ncbi:MAG: hypothetical protein K2V38_06535, partial [Gemmataceae bacterium]|nr:hypothetical protein [Gemmataceae bacterium]
MPAHPFLRWVRRLSRARKTPISRTPLNIEPLEDRVVLDARFWTGLGDGTNWTNPANWTGNAVPASVDDVTIDVPGTVTVVLRGSVTVRSLVNRETLHVAGATSTGAARLTVTGDVSNAGTVRLETTSFDGFDRGSYLSVGGLFTNDAGARVEANVGQGGNRSLTGSLLNRGTVAATGTQSFTIGGAGKTVTLESGSFDAGASGQLFIDQSRFAFTGGSTTGVVRALNSTLAVGAGVTTASTVRAIGASGVLENNASPAVTVWVEGTTTWGRAVLTTAANATNAGTIRLETTSSDGFDRGSYLSANAGGFVNLAGGTVVTNVGTGDARSVSGNLINRGRITTNASTSLRINGSFTADGGVIDGSGPTYLVSTTLSVTAPASSPTTLRTVGSTTLTTDNLA